jgi:hypothetical protein
MGQIIIDAEFKAVNRALTGEEYEALREKIRREGPKDPIWFGSGPLAETVLDGHNRLGIYEALQITDYPTINAPGRDPRGCDQLDHRSPAEPPEPQPRGTQLPDRQEVSAGEGAGQESRGGQDDGGAARRERGDAREDRAPCRRVQHTGRHDRRERRPAGRAGDQAGVAGMSAETVARVPTEPTAKQPKVFASAKGTKSRPAKLQAMAADFEAEKKAARKKALEAAKPITKPERPDLAGMIRDLNVAWPARAVATYEPTESERRELKAHLPDLLDKLGRVYRLIGRLERSQAAAAPEPEPADDSADQPDAVGRYARLQPFADRILADYDHVAVSRTAYAARIGISTKTLNRARGAKPIDERSRHLIEAYLDRQEAAPA